MDNSKKILLICLLNQLLPIFPIFNEMIDDCLKIYGKINSSNFNNELFGDIFGDQTVTVITNDS